MRNEYLAAVAVIVLVGVAVVAITWKNYENVHQEENFVVYDVSGGFAGIHYTFTIMDNSTMTDGVNTEVLPENEFQEFRKLVISANIFDIVYPNTFREHWPDSFGYNLTFTIAGNTRTFSYSDADISSENMPEKLSEIIGKINEFKNRL
jgi:hypothetical protein